MNVTLLSDHAGRLFSNASSLPLPKTSWVCSFRIAFKVNLSHTLLTLWLHVVFKKQKQKLFPSLIVFSYHYLVPNDSFQKFTPNFEVMQKVCCWL